ncbi:MAG TPA: alanine--glyoxylate aminotransferase family protein [Anaerolineales bacterium]|nr:alanine--glyoxylate aminotransferase family protein [Anaerolineales bacterium]
MARLFIPGPTDVAPEILAAQAQPMIGHRSQGFAELFGRIQPKLRQVFATQHRVFVTASSGSGLQEAAVRNCAARRVLVAVNGAFSQRWYEVAVSNGVAADRIDVPWGQAISPDLIEAAVSNSDCDAIAVVHNESSTGVENPIASIAAAARAVRPEILVLVDAVSSAAGVRIETDAWGLDVVLTSSQKCFALPPGLAFGAVSDKALERAATVSQRGWYFDFLLLEKYLGRNMTPATPALSLLYALDAQLDRILAEGLEERFARHIGLARFSQEWGADRFGFLAQEGYRSKTVTAFMNSRSFDIAALNAYLAEHGMVISNGYGPLKGKTFRIGHMGETRLADLEVLFKHIDEFSAGHQDDRTR